MVIGRGAERPHHQDLAPALHADRRHHQDGLVSAPLYSRFGITARLDLYDQEELEQIVERTTSLLSMEMVPDVRPLLARSSRGTPRVAIRLVRRMRDYAQVWGDGTLTGAIVDRGLRALGIDRYGLDRTDREILSIIIERYAGGPVGVETLAISLGETADTVEDVYEPFLVQSGFLKRTARGRVVTDLAVRHVRGNAGDEEGTGAGPGLLF